MKKTNIKKLVPQLLMIVTMSILFGQSTSYAVDATYLSPISRNICTLMVKPYDSTKPAVTDPAIGDPLINYLNSACSKFVTYGNAYSPQPPKIEDNPLKTGAEKISIPTTRHDHKYYNDDDAAKDAFYHLATMEKFEIKVQSDGFNSIKLDDIKCQTPYPSGYDTNKITPIVDCDGTISDLWGGTTVSKKTVGNTFVITWDFAQTPDNGSFVGRPIIWGNNGAKFPEGDFTSDTKRNLEFNVHLPSKDNNGNIWSTTTTSRALIIHWAIHKKNYPANDGKDCFSNDINSSASGWCYLNPDPKYTSEAVFISDTKKHPYYWFPVGSVATVWKKIQAPTPPNVCTELTATLDDKNPIKINGKDAYPMSVNTITFAPKNILPEGAELKWSTTDPNGQFWTYENLTPNPDLPKKAALLNELNTNWVNTYGNLEKTIYYLGLPESKITVALDKIPADQNSPLCKASMTSPAAPECLEILVDHQEPINEGTYSVFKAKSLDTDYKDLNAKIIYTVDEGYGEFYTIKPSDYETKKNKSKFILEATPTSQTAPLTPTADFTPDLKLDPKILIFGNDLDQMATSWININTKIATGKFGIQDLSANINDLNNLSNAIDQELIFLPEWMTSGLPPSTNPVDPFMNPLSDQTHDSNPGKYSLNSVFDIDPTKQIIDQNISIKDLTLTGNEFLDKNYAKSFLFSTTGAIAPGTDVYFYAKKSGKNVIHVKTQGSTNPKCKKDYDIEPKPQLICKELKLITNPKDNLLTGQPAQITTITTKDTAGFKLPLTTKYKIATTTNGKFQSVDNNYKPSGINLGNNVLLSDFPISLVGATTAGNVTVTVDPQDPAYDANCKGSINVITPPQAICVELNNLNIYDFNDTTKTNLSKPTLQPLVKNKIYVVKSNLKTQPDAANDQVTYTVDSKYGTFLDTTKITAGVQLPGYVNLIQIYLFSLPPQLDSTLPALKALPTTSQITVPENQEVYLITYNNPQATSTGTIENILTVKSAGYTNPSSCATSIPFNNPAPVPTTECKSLKITPVTDATPPVTTSFDAKFAQGQKFLLTGDYSNHTGEIKVEITSNVTAGTKPTIGKVQNPSSSTFNFTNAEVKSSNNKLTFFYLPQSFGQNNPNPNTLIITADAISPNISSCHDQIPATAPITQPCNPAIQQCVPGPEFCTLYPNDIKCKKDDGGGTTYTAPTFEKFALSDSKKAKADKKVININKNTKEVTYTLKFTAGSKTVNEISISDPTIKNGHISRKDQKTFDPKEGYLDFSSIEIMHAEKILYSNTDTKTKFEKCKPSETKACIETDISSIINEFENGRPITLKYLNPKSIVLINYKMNYKNGSTLNDRCNKYKAEKGCGEIFENTAQYKIGTASPISSNKVQVIAICPYILSRQGGDVFFHDLIKTGVDVNKCYDVKSCDGPCIKPKPPKEKNTTESGGNNENKPAPLLQSPSHEVCNLSNKGAGEGGNEGLAAYQDVLENFSSSICELEADISKAWTKQNITDSINANVKRLSRFGNNLNGKGNNAQSALSANSINSSNGVFIKTDGDLYLNEATIHNNLFGDVNTPSAQTYIVIGYDLHIQSNIQYKQSILDNFYMNGKNNIPSAAFIVINGNIIIDRDVTQIDGILMAVDTDGKDTDGKNLNPEGADGQIRANGSTDSAPLNINGSLIGNVLHLFTNRQYAGDPLQDDGSVNIHYDERILLNPPPGINELINLQQVVVPN